MRLRTNKPLPIPPFLFKNEGFTGEIMKTSDPASFLTTATVAFAVLLTLAPSRVSAQEGTTVAVDASPRLRLCPNFPDEVQTPMAPPAGATLRPSLDPRPLSAVKMATTRGLSPAR